MKSKFLLIFCCLALVPLLLLLFECVCEGYIGSTLESLIDSDK